MIDYRVSLEEGEYYHIFNHSVGNMNMFIEDKNYTYFIDKFETYICPYVRVYAYCLMPNHFHFLIKVKEGVGVGMASSQTPLKVSDCLPSAFKSLFTSYTNSFNKVYKRRGSLFEPRYKRLLIETETHLKNTIVYIHNNPVKHGFVKSSKEWNFSSYNHIVNKTNPSWLVAEETIGYFNDKSNFIFCHQNKSIGKDDYLDL
jgi:putative transposase